jgi:hypothetical protein
MTESNNNNNKSNNLALVVATRLHLGQASVAPKQEALRAQVVNFANFCERAQASVGVIAVDATPVLTAKLELQKKKQSDGECPADADADADASNVVFDLVEAVHEICLTITDTAPTVTLHVLPVTPWGQFVPALNALISFAATTTCRGQVDGTMENNNRAANCILFVSAETTMASRTALQSLLTHLDLETTLVVGARLPGHDYQHIITPGSCRSVVKLNGRTTPWNTLAVWNLRQLALTGFIPVSEGFLTDAKKEPSQGVEEVMAISLLQHIFGPTKAMAKLVQLATSNDAASDTDDASNGGLLLWEEKFIDPQRQAWHDAKMKSKLERAARQVALFPEEMTSAQVHHC